MPAPRSRKRTKATFAIKAKKKKPRHISQDKISKKIKSAKAKKETGALKAAVEVKQKLFQKDNASKGSVKTRKERKEQLRELKKRKNKNYGVVMEITTLWEKLRPRNVTESQKRKLVALAMTRVKGRILELVRNPKASRVLQCCLQYGCEEDRQAVLGEIHEGLAPLSMTKYGKHLVQRLIAKTSQEDFHHLFRVFPAHCVRLLKHQYGSDVMNDLYCKCSDVQRHELMMVCYGCEVHSASLDDEWIADYNAKKAAGIDPSSFETVFQEADAVRRAGALEKLHGLLTVMIEKGLLVNRLVHRLILEFFRSAPAAHVEDMSIMLAETGDGLLKMVHTSEGVAIAAAVLRYSDASHRKIALRGFKDYVKETVLDEWGFVVCVMAFRVVDDTKMLHKTLLGGIIDHLEEICTHRYGRCVVLDILHPNCNWYLPKRIEPHLNPRLLEIVKEGSEGLRHVGVSKKDVSVRRQELLSEGEGSLSDALLKMCLAKAASLLKCRRGCDVLVEVARGGEDGYLDANGIKQAQRAIIDACADASLLTERIPKGAVIQLIHFSSQDTHHFAKHFCKSLWRKIFQGNCKNWLQSDRCSILAALMTCGSKTVRSSCRSEVEALLKDISVETWLKNIQRSKDEKRQTLVQKRLKNKQKSS